MRVAHGKTRPMKIFMARLNLIGLLLALLVAGCATRPVFNSSPASIENKAYLITRIAVSKVIAQHPHAGPKLQIAADDLLIIEKSDAISVAPILAIIQRLPPDTFNDPNTGLYIEAGVLFFADELGTLGAQNPEQLKAAVRGMRRGLESFLVQ